MALPTIDLMEITPQFVKDHIFIVLLLGDTAITGFINFATGGNFAGIIGSIISFAFGSLLNFATGLSVNVSVHTWQILFLVLVIQFGLLKLLSNTLFSLMGRTSNTPR